MKQRERLEQIVHIAYERMCGKIKGQRIEVSSEASLQLQLASILKILGELYEETPSERFNIELEKSVFLQESQFVKSKTNKAKIDIWVALENIKTGETNSCAIELKYFKKANHREPNNRYDVFKDLHNLESYGDFVDIGFLLVATDHSHYINKTDYSPDTRDFDFRDEVKYYSGTELVYRTQSPYGPPISLNGSYKFEWRKVEKGLNFLFLSVNPC
jgi:hypothetical protein